MLTSRMFSGKILILFAATMLVGCGAFNFASPFTAEEVVAKSFSIRGDFAVENDLATTSSAVKGLAKLNAPQPTSIVAANRIRILPENIRDVSMVIFVTF